jgi:hypothetical protein
VVDFGGVLVDGGGGLGAEVAIAGVEIEGADVVGAVGAGELHAPLNAGDGVEAFHNSSVTVSRRSERHGGWAAKVTKGDRGGVPKWESGAAKIAASGVGGGQPRAAVPTWVRVRVGFVARVGMLRLRREALTVLPDFAQHDR